jgi:flagellin
MSLSILTNLSAMNTHRNLLNTSGAVSTAMERLSSGLRINSAADDAAGYAISQGLTTQVNSLDQASRNVGDAISMVQTAESSLNNIQNMLQRISELAVQYQNGDLSTQDQTDLQSEVNQLTQEIDRQRNSIQFNGITLLDGSAGGSGASGSVTFQVGGQVTDTLTTTFSDIEGSKGLGVTGFSWGTSGATAQAGGQVFSLGQANAVSLINAAITNISTLAAGLGAVQNRLQYTADAIAITEQNMTAAKSSITDVDMAKEMTMLTQQQILQQAGTAMLAQANAQPQMILKLLQ